MSSSALPEPAASSLLVEPLEPRIAPAALIDPTVAGSIVAVTVGTPQLLDATHPGQPTTLSTSNAGGAYLIHVDAGAAMIFTTDTNGNGQFDFNEITGIALSNNAHITIFTNVNGDIATNLQDTGNGSFQLTDSDNNAANGRDGLVILPSNVQNITLRSLTATDLNTNVPGETVVNRIALSGYSIFGSLYVGGDFGAATGTGAGGSGAVNGLVIDPSGASVQAAKYNGSVGTQLFPGLTTPPSVGAIKTGTATSYGHLSFGNSFGADVTGDLGAFTPAPNAHGGDIFGIQSVNNAPFSISVLAAGDGGAGVGGTGARGGNISNVTLNGEHGGYELLAGNGGTGVSGGVGGSVSGFNDLGSITSLALIHSGDGGHGTLMAGGAAGTVSLGTVATVANLRVLLGDGGDGLTKGGDGSSQPFATVAPPASDVSLGVKVLSTTRDSFTFINALTGLPTTNPQPGDQLATVLDPSTGQMVAVHAYDIGATRSVDFDGDGFSDALYTTSNPDQLVLVFGKDPNANRVNPDGAPAQLSQRFDGSAIDPSKTIFLDAPFNPQAVVIGDFNADGRPDVAVASADPGSFGGISVYLNQIADTVRNPTNVPSFTGNPLGSHPFSDALHSNIPALGELYGNPVGQPVGGYFQSPVAIRNLVVGDFNGDGVLDLAYLGVYTPRVITTSSSVVTVLFGDTDSNHAFGNGYFYANPALPTDSPASRVQFSPTSLGATGAATSTLGFQLIATSLTSDIPGTSLHSNQPAPLGTFNFGQHDSLFVAPFGGSTVTEFAVTSNQGAGFTGALAHQPTTSVLTSELTLDANSGIGLQALGSVDTNRDLALIVVNQGVSQVVPNTTSVSVALADYTIVDFNHDGRADLVAISDQPAQFLVAFTGTKATATPTSATPGTYNFTDASSPFSGPDNRGFVLGSSSTGRALRPTDDPTAFTPTSLAIFTLSGNGNSVREGALTQMTAPANPASGTQSANFFPFAETPLPVALNTFGSNTNVISFDLFRSRSDQGLGVIGYQALSPSQGSVNGDYLDFAFRGFANGGFTDLRLTANGIEARAGDGGDALGFGAGGKGGSVGGALNPSTAANATGAVTVTLSASQAYRGTVSLRGGSGGDGFTGAGDGGDVTGVVVRYAGGASVLTSNAQLIAGEGGSATGGTGGRGGDIAQVTIATGTLFQAGDGGGGLNGNRGGNITGNTLGLFDTTTVNVTALAGDGGIGRLNGGSGGSVTGFRSQFLNVLGGVAGSLTYTAGNGGSGGGGTGGTGGDLLNDSPDSTQNALAGVINLTAGAGGSGLTGGRGGNVDTFTNAPSTQSALPTSINVLGGDGGSGITGLGGLGGNIRNVNVAAGLNANFSGTTTLNRAIAGAGGASFSLDGGAGGSITGSTLTSVAQPFAAASGAGGIGLLSGGAGGSVTGDRFDSAGTAGRVGKVLVIAGAGGDASAISAQDIVLSSDPLIPGRAPSLARLTLAVGGQSGVGGDGGSIVNFTQPASTAVSVDLVAGNGGSIRYGNSVTPTGNVGRGGSVTGASVAGEIGSSGVEAVSNVSPPIRAYNDVNGDGTVDETLAQFVANTLRTNSALLVSFNDGSTNTAAGTPVAVGNVGIVAGVAGRVAAVNGVAQPALGTPNGAVTNVSARNIMSIVAGSVDSVAPVDNVANIRVTSGERILGADKSPTTPGLPGYRPTGTADTLVQYLDLTGQVVSDLQPGDRLIDGAIYTFANTTGELLGNQGNQRVFFASGG